MVLLRYLTYMIEKHSVKIRFNTNYKDGDNKIKEWRVLVNGFENFCNHVTVNCACHTSKDFIDGVGNKWHISCEPVRIEYIKDEHIKENDTNLFKEIILH